MESNKSLERKIRFAILVSDWPFMDYSKARSILLDGLESLETAPWYIIVLYSFYEWMHFFSISKNTRDILEKKIKKNDKYLAMYSLCILFDESLTTEQKIMYGNISFQIDPTVFVWKILYESYMKANQSLQAKSVLKKALSSVEKIWLWYSDYDWNDWREYINNSVKQIYIQEWEKEKLEALIK